MGRAPLYRGAIFPLQNRGNPLIQYIQVCQIYRGADLLHQLGLMVYSKTKYDALRSFYDQIERGESYVSAAEQAIEHKRFFNQVWGEGNLEKQYPCYDGNGENDLLNGQRGRLL